MVIQPSIGVEGIEQDPVAIVNDTVDFPFLILRIHSSSIIKKVMMNGSVNRPVTLTGRRRKAFGLRPLNVDRV